MKHLLHVNYLIKNDKNLDREGKKRGGGGVSLEACSLEGTFGKFGGLSHKFLWSFFCGKYKLVLDTCYCSVLHYEEDRSAKNP